MKFRTFFGLCSSGTVLGIGAALFINSGEITTDTPSPENGNGFTLFDWGSPPDRSQWANTLRSPVKRTETTPEASSIITDDRRSVTMAEEKI